MQNHLPPRIFNTLRQITTFSLLTVSLLLERFRKLWPQLLCLFWHLLAMPAAVKASDIEIIEQRIKASVLSSVPAANSVNGYQSTLQADGHWTDIDYGQTTQTNWRPITHLDRMHAMARAYAASNCPLYQNTTLRKNILKAYDFWLSRDPRSTNWYHNQIATPQRLGEIMILIKNDLSAAQKTTGLAMVARSYVPRTTNSGTNTGANRIDRAYPSLIRGLLTPNASLVSESFLAIGDTIVITTNEGIQPDYSYQQHGSQLYMAGYGSVYIGGITRYGLFGAGTEYGFSASQLRTLVDFATEGLPWFIRGNTIDYTASGRGLTRKGSTATAKGVASQLNSLLRLNNGYRTAELLKLKERYQSSQANGTADPTKAQTGNRYFWRSDTMTHHRPAYSISVKTSSTRTLQPESGNGEGLKNLHLGDGVTLIQRTGNEYDEIMPVWDWRRLPGTTTEQRDYDLKPDRDWGVAGASTFAGGASNGSFGVSAFQYDRLNVAVKKSWFFFDQEMVALGAGLHTAAPKNAVQTSLNQTLQNGSVLYQTDNRAAQTLASGSITPANLNWVHHDGVGYNFFAPVSTAKIAASEQSGTWQSINRSYDATTVTKNVFSLDLSHGTSISHGSYAYSVVPGITAKEMPDYHASNKIQILSNSSAIQAVKNQALGVTAATFWNDGISTIDGITVNRKACVVVKKDGQVLDVAISDPTQTNTGSISLQLATPVKSLISSDQAVSITQSSSGVRMTISVDGSRGRTFRARFHSR